MKIRINHVSGYTPGAIINIPTDGEGTPLDRFWRNRLKDAATDNCIEVVKPSKSAKKGAVSDD